MERNEIMFDLVRKQKWDEVVSMLKDYDNLDTNIRDNNNNYLITYAVLFNKIDVVSLLIHKGSKLDVRDADGRSILFICIKYGYNDILELLLHFNKTHIGISLVDIQDKNGNIPLHYAIQSKNLKAIDDLITAGSNVNHKDKEGHNSLHLAVYTRDSNICKIIMNQNIDINSKTLTGETALHIACNLELDTIVEMLIESGIDINMQDNDNEFTALSYCVNRNNPILTAILLKGGANPNIQDFFGNTPLHYSIIEGNLEIFNQLVGSKYTKDIINFNLYNIDSRLPLHLVLVGDKRINDFVSKLIEGTNLVFQDTNGNSCLHGLIKKNIWKKWKNVLVKKKIDIFIANKWKVRPVDYIDNQDIKEFIEMAVDSYIYIIRSRPYCWKQSWENMCKKDISFDKMNDKEKKLASEFITDPNKVKGDICKPIITKILLDITTGKINGKSYPSRKDTIEINISEGKNIEFCTFTGITLDILLGVVVLLKKHSNVCSTITTEFMKNTDLCSYYKQLGVISETSCEFLNFELVWVYQKLYLSHDFINQFKKCLKKKIRFIIIPLAIELREGSHANYLIYDNKLKEIERFEPHGSNHPYKFDYNQNLLDNILKTRFETNFEGIKYIRPGDYLPKIGFQIFDSYENNCRKIGDPKGFCALWSIWYTDMRIQYPDVDRKLLVELIISRVKSDNISFKNLIRNYSDDIIQLRDTILKGAELNINDWLNNKYTTKQLSDVVEQIKKIILSLK